MTMGSEFREIEDIVGRMDTAPGLTNQANDAEHIQIIDDSHDPESEDHEELREERVLKPP